jgi:hypothetical protein
MSLIRDGYAVSTRRGFSRVLFSVLLAPALFDPRGFSVSTAWIMCVDTWTPLAAMHKSPIGHYPEGFEGQMNSAH